MYIQVEMGKSSHYKHLFYSLLGINAQDMGPTMASHIFKVQWNVAHYWKKKRLNCNFHNNTHGGAR